MTNRIIKNSKICCVLVLLSFLFLIISCGAHTQGKILVDRNQKISIPVKLLIYSTDKDSSLTRLYIPIEFDLTNKFDSRVTLYSGYYSIRGGNVDSGPISLLIGDKLDLAFRNIKFDTNEKKHFKAYTSYKIMISNVEKEQILKDAEFAQYRFDTKREVYNIGMINDVPSFLLKKVPDSLKGFIRMEFQNRDTKKNFAENIPVEF